MITIMMANVAITVAKMEHVQRTFTLSDLHGLIHSTLKVLKEVLTNVIGKLHNEVLTNVIGKLHDLLIESSAQLQFLCCLYSLNYTVQNSVQENVKTEPVCAIYPSALE